jgi:5-methylcytosine-specific restriction endonuclease McrA
MKYKSSSNRWRSSGGKVRYMKWRKSVFELNKGLYGVRKYYVCVKCNKKRKTTRTLHAHHIYSWNKYPNKRYTIKNGVVLCKYCHNKFHRKYKYDALENPSLLSEWCKDKRINEYINKENE